MPWPSSRGEPAVSGAKVVPMKEIPITAHSNGRVLQSPVSCVSARKALSQSRRCDVSFIVRALPDTWGPAARPVQAVCLRVCSTEKGRNFSQKETNVPSVPVLEAGHSACEKSVPFSPVLSTLATSPQDSAAPNVWVRGKCLTFHLEAASFAVTFMTMDPHFSTITALCAPAGTLP